jgi:hypothetical protein
MTGVYAKQRLRTYTCNVARGWEQKSVAALIESVNARRGNPRVDGLSYLESQLAARRWQP